VHKNSKNCLAQYLFKLFQTDIAPLRPDTFEVSELFDFCFKNGLYPVKDDWRDGRVVSLSSMHAQNRG
jgi:hypothetical protein